MPIVETHRFIQRHANGSPSEVLAVQVLDRAIGVIAAKIFENTGQIVSLENFQGEVPKLTHCPGSHDQCQQRKHYRLRVQSLSDPEIEGQSIRRLRCTK